MVTSECISPSVSLWEQNLCNLQASFYFAKILATLIEKNTRRELDHKSKTEVIFAKIKEKEINCYFSIICILSNLFLFFYFEFINLGMIIKIDAKVFELIICNDFIVYMVKCT